jgi:5-methylthioribose kinase
MATTDISSYDLTTEAGVEGYLSTTAFACTKAETLSGGTANFVYRLHLRQYRDGKETLVLKHGQAYIKNLPNIAFDIRRQVTDIVKYELRLANVSSLVFRGRSFKKDT